MKSSSMPPALANLSANVFNDDAQREHMSPTAYNAFQSSIKTGEEIPKDTGKEIAASLMEWAMQRGAVNFSHVFYPMRGAKSGTKTDAFIDLDFGDKKALKDIQCSFDISKLWMSETDGSSFPNGGLRATHTAAAYMVADKSSNPYVKDDTLYIPSAFVTWNGDALDWKTPLLRSQEAVNIEAVRLLKNLGYDDVNEVYSNIGCEQEFFAIPRELAIERPDIVATGRTILGANPSRGQQLSDHYFGKINPRVKAFLVDFQEEMWKLGVSQVVYHNEVAPAQHEWSPIFSLANVAADQNILCMEVANDIGLKHGLAILNHEKPYADINGSGKHVNWGLNSDTGMNLFTTGKNDKSEASFIAFVAAVTYGLGNYAEAFRASVQGAGNDHRLGGHEAPPAIFSIYTGVGLGEHLDSVVSGGPLQGYNSGRYGAKMIDTGARATGKVGGGAEDRNRTAPLPFCGNRFEFRAVGSDANVSLPTIVLNTTAAAGCAAISDLIEGGASVRDAVAQVLGDNMKCIFNGDGYSSEWHEEAEHERGLPNLKTTPDALLAFNSDKNKELFTKYKVYSEAELESVTNIFWERYMLDIEVEADTMLDMINQGVLPACGSDLRQYKKHHNLSGPRYAVYSDLATAIEALQTVRDAWPMDDHVEGSMYARDVVIPAMTAVRAIHDKAERLIATDLYPFPTYHEMLHNHQMETEPTDY